MAKVYLDSGDNFTLSSAATVYGSTGTEKVVVNSGVTGVTIDASVERVDLSGASSAYTFKQAGNTLQVYSGTTLVATTTVQDDTNGSQLVFSNGSVDVKMATGGTMTLGGATVSSTAAGAVTPTTIDAGTTSGSGTGGSGGTGGTTTAQTLVLGTGIDVPATGSGDDVIVGDFGGTTPTLNAGDQIAGGAGTDTLKMYGLTKALLASNMPVSITSIEKFEFVNGPDNNNIDLSNYTAAATGLTNIVFGNVATMNGKMITTTTGQSLSLATGAGGVATAGMVTWAGAATDATLNLTLNGYQGGTGVTPWGLTVTGASAKTLNIASTGAANKVGVTGMSYFTGPTTVTKHVITGDKALSYALAAADCAAVTTIDASASTGGVSVNMKPALTAATFTFTGGNGDDTITFIDNEFGTLTAGTQLVGGGGVDKIGLFDTAITVAEAAKINAATGFEKIGLNAAITLDASTLSNYKTFDIDTTALTQTITNLATGSTVNVGAGATGTFTQTSLTLGGAVGVTDVTINLGGATDAVAHTITDAVLTGLTNVKLSSNGALANTFDTAVMVNSDNTTFTLSGAADLTMGRVAATTTGSKIDGSAATGKLTLVGNTAAFSSGSALGDTLIGGSNDDSIKASINGGSLTGNGGADTFDVTVALGGLTATFNTTTITDFTKGDKIKVINTGTSVFTATKVDLSAAASVGAALDLLAAGAGNMNGIVKWGNYGGNTYLVNDNGAGATFAATDIMVKLIGTLDLSTSTYATDTLTFA